MQTPTPTTEYDHGQMMGMLVVITMVEKISDLESTPYGPTFEKIKRLAAKDLSEYLNKPEEDVYLLVDEELKAL